MFSKNQVEQNKWLLPQSNNSPSNLFSQLINSLGIRKRCFPIILPWENSACGWKLMSTARHTLGQPGEVGLSSFLLPSFQGAWELPWGQGFMQDDGSSMFGRLCSGPHGPLIIYGLEQLN